ncbi:MAG: 4Fe-4S dicluster domain-containing protein [Candidatus Thiodiazotropha sp. (ex Dulcina madagascariensis)]|nr:4Fe-4S dicluster domain-containing protein [Candidatus Thiodiazotropha sp. (ex Dulcina madagascariensis)]
MTKSRCGEAVNSQTTINAGRRPGFLARNRLQELFDAVTQTGYRMLGPVARDGAIQFAEMTSVEQLAPGLINEQQPGQYRLRQGEGERLFDWNHGPQGIKPHCFSPGEILWSEQGDPLRFQPHLPEHAPIALVGVRACDLAALAIQDKHFLNADAPDPHYRQRRGQLLLIGVDCAHSAETCFCASTGDGPALDGGYDIGISELDEGFLLWPGNDKGQAITARLTLQPADDRQLESMLQMSSQAAQEQQRSLPQPSELRRLYRRLEHSHWQDVADRCLACGNCTAVCPTCFCYDTRHEMSLDGANARMVRRWDSCFSAGHSNMAGLLVRDDTLLRYRQWLTHKLAGWQEQQGRIGCTGCGRCISWCPVGIDLTQEAAAVLREGSVDV